MLIDVVNNKSGKAGKLKVQSLDLKDVTVAVGFHGKVTAAIASINGTQAIGIATCMKGDKYSEDIGTGIATGRAIKAIGEQMESVWSERSVTKKEWKEKHSKKDTD